MVVTKAITRIEIQTCFNNRKKLCIVEICTPKKGNKRDPRAPFFYLLTNLTIDSAHDFVSTYLVPTIRIKEIFLQFFFQEQVVAAVHVCLFFFCIDIFVSIVNIWID